MDDIAIRVDNLGKRYRIGKAKQRHDTLRDALASTVHGSAQKLSSVLRRPPPGGSPRQNDAHIWALRDVSFEIKRGEVVGIIGRNGAGKSTLLKILSRITEPTEGRAEIHGRVGSLLEVGTGFHPELTGRENIYLSGAILGMRRAEIDRRFDEIVAFSGVEKFIDTPIKRYSSGMNVRLGFAVAAHLEPEILLVDEVLAVGDAAFQRKCLGKMSQVAEAGRTVLFVSHNMAAVTNLCSHAVLLLQGMVAEMGHPQDVSQAYIHSGRSVEPDLARLRGRSGNGSLRFTEIKIWDQSGDRIRSVECGQDVTIEIAYVAKEEKCLQSAVFSIGFYSMLGQPLFLCRSDLQGTEYPSLPRAGSVLCRIPRFPLPPGEFHMNLHCELKGVVADWVVSAKKLLVTEGDFYGSGKLPPKARGDLLVEHYWLPVGSP